MAQVMGLWWKWAVHWRREGTLLVALEDSRLEDASSSGLCAHAQVAQHTGVGLLSSRVMLLAPT